MRQMCIRVSPATFVFEGWGSIREGSPYECGIGISAWKKLGATHISVNTMSSGLSSPDDHIKAIRRFKEVVVEQELLQGS